MSRHGSGGGYEKILAVVRAAKGRIRQNEVLTGVGWTVLATSLTVLTLAVLDNLLYLPSLARIILLLAAFTTVGAFRVPLSFLIPSETIRGLSVKALEASWQFAQAT